MMYSSSASTGIRRNENPGSGVRPSPVTESSLLETVGSFINEVQTIADSTSDPKIQVTWARFEMSDINDPSLHGNEPPLLLILGYTSGVQVWSIPSSSGEAVEVLSWKHFTLKTLRILPTPILNPDGENDNFAHLRPLIVLSEISGSGIPFSSASFMSLKTGEQVHNIKFNSEISDIVVNRQVIVILFKEKLAVFNARNLEAVFTISSCFPSPGIDINPIALGDRWLAYADKKMMPVHRSFGGMEMEGGQSVTAWGINVGSKLAKGVSKIYSNIFSHGNRPGSSTANTPSPITSTVNNEPQKGIVTVLDVQRVSITDSEELNLADNLDGIVAHFIAHNKAIVAMKFDSSASLLLTCDRLGNYFNVFRIVPHPSGSCYSAVHHLYSLYRGDTPGSVQDIAFSSDSRWVAVSTLRGTTHIFPITPYGGPVGVRTHTSDKVVNRLSRFHRSAGIDSSALRTTSGRDSPNPTLGSSPSAGSGGAFMETNVSPPIIPYPNPHLPPFPTPALIQPIAQLRQPYLLSSLQHLGSVSKKGGGRPAIGDDIPIRLACTFAPSRAWLIGTQHTMFTRQQRNKHMDSLFVMANHGVLLEYTLDPVPESTLTKDKICESSPIELHIVPYGQWTLNKPRDRAELQPPLSIDNPLMLQVEPNIPHKERSVEDNQWLSQVEILTHIGPHRRLWMGPQFSFKILQPVGGEDSDELRASDVNLQPKQSHPLNMGCRRTGPVFIEAGSASSSFELSPRFHNFNIKRSGSQLDLESELHEAMAENIIPEDSLRNGPRNESKEDDFFCLTPDDLSKGARSRNASATDTNKLMSTMSSSMSISNQISDSKIFSVAVESCKLDPKINNDLHAVNVESSEYSSSFAVVSSKKDNSVNIKELNPTSLPSQQQLNGVAVSREITPVQNEHTADLISLSNESVNMLTEAISSVVESPLKTAKNNSIEFETFSSQFQELKVEERIEKEGMDVEEEDDEEEGFFISNRSASIEKEEEEEDDDIIRPDSVPKVRAWVGNLLNEDDSTNIMKDIENAEEKYNDDNEDFNYMSSHLKLEEIISPQTTIKIPPNSRPTDSSEDEVSAPTVLKRYKKKKSYRNNSAHSESDKRGEDYQRVEHEGWSFEDEDLDFNKLISEMGDQEVNTYKISDGCSSNNRMKNISSSTSSSNVYFKVNDESSSEKVSLDDVFKFDSEIQKKENPTIVATAASLTTTPVEAGYDSMEDGGLTIGGGSSAFVGGSTSESSVGNSPNVKKIQGRNRKKKSRR
ncbi:LOW QUALITY PROTEIN: BCAS3 microtubule associated cell migration factor [Lepeophtheirus salmonis]|uniref:LOW QUALITY PROTEIN: BCAS3 microtubule associated cell migration factor n=1 Tax=Lepeophtheirus salmonis TaxID=72036 RepID=UPI003AF3AADA